MFGGLLEVRVQPSRVSYSVLRVPPRVYAKNVVIRESVLVSLTGSKENALRDVDCHINASSGRKLSGFTCTPSTTNSMWT